VQTFHARDFDGTAFCIERFKLTLRVSPMVPYSETICDPLTEPKPYRKSSDVLAFPDLHRFIVRDDQIALRRMNREDHAVVTFSTFLKSPDIVIEHPLTCSALHLHEGNFVRRYVLCLDVNSFDCPAQLRQPHQFVQG
jgi:hypothetical protein